MSSVSCCPNFYPHYATIPRDADVYRNNLKNREFDQETSQNFDLERVTIAHEQGASEDRNFERKSTPSKTDYSSCFGIRDPKATWKITTVQKTNQDGHLVRNKDGGYHFDYMEEVATGDFYQLDEPDHLGGVAGAILLLGWLYCSLNMAANFVSIAVDIVGISIEALAKVGKEWKKLTKGEALGNFALRIVVEIPIAIVQDIWGIARAPFYTAAMMTIAVYGLFNPIGARPWYNKIEKHWHDGKGYEYDFRHHAPQEFKLKEYWQGYREGKIIFMAYCCLKCGNKCNPRFQLVKV